MAIFTYEALIKGYSSTRMRIGAPRDEANHALDQQELIIGNARYWNTFPNRDISWEENIRMLWKEWLILLIIIRFVDNG